MVRGTVGLLVATAWLLAACTTLTPAQQAALAPLSGTSIREASLTGPRSDQPLSVQYAVKSAKRVTFRSTTHLVAET